MQRKFVMVIALTGVAMLGAVGWATYLPVSDDLVTDWVPGAMKIQATTVYVHDNLLSIPKAQRDNYAETDSFLRSGRELAAFIRDKYPSKKVHVVHWPLNSAEEILSTNPEDYRTGEELRNGAILIKIVGSTGSAPWVGRPTNGHANLLVTGDPEVLGANSLKLAESEEGDVKCGDPRCSDPEQLIASIRGRVERVIEGR